ncbi:hypothetical protein K440DRAFT_165646 [Wilcoxina mikolae CBS 423.85]|nr:hypothetical protein K440DRAFT_165646 [Wilcoxina mikolae CBS 423.85]
MAAAAATTDGLTLLASRLLLTPASHSLRQTIITKQRTLATQLWPTASVTACGSFAHGTSLHNSDLDLVISLPPQQRYPLTPSWAERLKTLNTSNAMIAKSDTAYVTKVKNMFLLHYEYPGDPEGEIEDVKVDVTFQPLGPMQGRDVFLAKAMDGIQGVREALVLMKAWMCFHGFAEPYTGGIGNYGLALGLIACVNYVSRTQPGTEMTPYTLICEYLKYCTDPAMPPSNGVVDVTTGEIVETQPWVSSDNYLMVMDPVVGGHVVGGKGFRREELREGMKGLLEVVEKEGEGMGVERAGEVFAGGDLRRAGEKRREVVKEAMKR